MKLKSFSALLVALLMSACGVHDKITTNALEVHGFDEEKLSFEKSVFASCKVLKLQENDACRIGNIHNIRILGNKIYVLASCNGIRTLCVFNKKGEFIRQVGKRGGAKNEYVFLDDFCFGDDGHVYLFDGVKKKGLDFDAQGNFIGKKDYPRPESCSSVEYVGKDSIMCFYHTGGSGPFCVIANLETREYTEMCDIRFKSEKHALTTIVHPMSRYKNKVRYLLPFDNTIYGLNGMDNLHVNTDLPKFTKEDMAQKSYAELSFDRSRFSGFQDLCETDNYVVCNSNEGSLVFLDKRKNTVFRMARWGTNDETMDIMESMLPIGVNMYTGDENDIVSYVRPYELLRAKESGHEKFLKSVCGDHYTDEDLNVFYLLFHKLN